MECSFDEWGVYWFILRDWGLLAAKFRGNGLGALVAANEKRVLQQAKAVKTERSHWNR